MAPDAPDAPPPIRELAERRAAARERRDWPEADRLRAELEAAGWRVVDRGTDFTLEPAHPPDREEDGRVRYGASGSVPSRWDEPPVGLASVVLRATDHPDDLDRALASLRAHAPDGTQVIVAADDPSAEQEGRLLAFMAGGGVAEAPATSVPEIVWTSARLGQAASLNAAMRRAAAPVVVLMDPSVELLGDAIAPLVSALDDPSVAVAGAVGTVSRDLRHFEEAPAGDVQAIEGYLQAFRRTDLAARSPLDERFRFYRNLDLWWSLVLRDEGEGVPPRRAVALELPIARHEHRGWTEVDEAERARLSKRNFYRIIDRFGSRRDLAG